jgi:hypothetical protein
MGILLQRFLRPVSLPLNASNPKQCLRTSNATAGENLQGGNRIVVLLSAKLECIDGIEGV